VLQQILSVLPEQVTVNADLTLHLARIATPDVGGSGNPPEIQRVQR